MGANRKPAADYATPPDVVAKQQKDAATVQTLGELDDFEMEGDEDQDMLGSDNDEGDADGLAVTNRSRSDSLFDELGDEQDYQLETEVPAGSQESMVHSEGISALFDQFMKEHAKSQAGVVHRTTMADTGEETFGSQDSGRDFPIDPALAAMLSRTA